MVLQRDLWRYVALQCLLVTSFLCRNGAFAIVNKNYDISTLCGRFQNQPLFKRIEGAVLTSEGEGDLQCTITFQTDTILQKFMLRFDSLHLDCNDHLYIFDGSHAYGNFKADLSCRSNGADVGTIFTESNFVTLKYMTDRSRHPGTGFKLIVTALKQFGVCREFQCLNSFCISKDLTCDDVNHCGDNSDERDHAYCTANEALNSSNITDMSASSIS